MPMSTAETKAAIAEKIIEKGGEFELTRLPVKSDAGSGKYLVYAEVPGRDQPVSVGLDADADGQPDPVEVQANTVSDPGP